MVSEITEALRFDPHQQWAHEQVGSETPGKPTEYAKPATGEEAWGIGESEFLCRTLLTTWIEGGEERREAGVGVSRVR